jgi:replication factor C subunit 3/5
MFTAAAAAAGQGDMRRVLNLLQSTHMAHGIVDEESTYLTAGAPLSADVTTVQEWLFNASFKDAYQRIQVCTLSSIA